MLAYVESTEMVEKGAFSNWVLHTRTAGGKLELKFWNMQNKDEFPASGDFLSLRMTDIDKANEEISKYRNLSLDSTSKNKPYHCQATIINEEDVPEDIRKAIKKDRGAQKTLAVKLLQDPDNWKDKDVHNFLLEFIKNNLERFTTAPAAISHHHNYKGGLIVHTSQVFANCLGVANAPTNAGAIDSDALFLASWLHDAGKMDVYSMEGESPRIDSEREKRIGHTTISNQMFLEASRGRFPQAFIDLVSHCILSHHEKPEWGAVVAPDTIEAHILCRADFISSRTPD